jgi:hypothetical protein
LSWPTGVTTAAVPQANTSTMSPLATPSRHSSTENLRSSTWWPSLPASSMMLDRVMPSRIVPTSGVTMCPSAYTKYMFMPPSSSTYWPSCASRKTTWSQPWPVASCWAISDEA